MPDIKYQLEHALLRNLKTQIVKKLMLKTNVLFAIKDIYQ